MTYKHKSGLLTAIILILVVALIVGALAAMSSGFTNWDTSTWFGNGNEETVEEEDPPVEDEIDEADSEVSGAVMGESTGTGMVLASASIARANYEEYGVSPMAETAYTLTATITPATADNKNVDWTVAWANASSSWASGKTVTDYVSVTPSSSGSLTATVECKQAFGEQIIVTCTSQQNAEAKASCTVDYYKRVSAIDASISNVDLSSGSDIPFTTGMSFTVKPTYSDGTLEDSYTHTAKVKFTSAFEDHLEGYSDNYIGGMTIRDFFGSGYTTEYTLNYGSINYTFFEALCYSDSGGSYTIDDDPYFIDIFYSALKEYSGDVFTFILTSTGTGSGITKQQTYDVSVNTSSIVINVAELELNEDGIIF